MTETYRIEAIALHEVGVFDDVRIDFPPISSPERDEQKAEIHVFTGPNGCGKSTLLYALAEIFDNFFDWGPVRRRFRNNGSHVDFLFSKISGFYGVYQQATSNEFGEYYARFGDLSHEGHYVFCLGQGKDMYGWQDLWEYKKAQKIFNKLPPPRNEALAYYAAFAYSGQRSFDRATLKAIQEINNSPFELGLSFKDMVRQEVLLQWIANNRAQSALAKADGDLPASQHYDHALNRITQAIKDICDLDIEFRLERQPLAVTLRIGNDTVQFDTLPDGLKSIISWIGDLSVRLEMIPWADQTKDIFAQNLILFLDEIDIHLHPKWQRKILPVIQKLFPNSQIFVSTHSPFVVGSVEDAWIYSLPEKGKQTERIIEPIQSRAGKSYRLILEEIFDIDKEFGDEVEALFDRFYKSREIFLKTQQGEQELLEIARDLANKGLETCSIIERELRQLSRLTGKELRLA